MKKSHTTPAQPLIKPLMMKLIRTTETQTIPNPPKTQEWTLNKPQKTQEWIRPKTQEWAATTWTPHKEQEWATMMQVMI